ncbi:glycoside hydrolase family 2 TIM barrel-domain containing protein [Pseudomarimonas arenosa]|uniref:Glycoside hydrolase family 2 catalytic domain-containing protein n=1 Tax=Pseudomarimonas arenosa TaxID=2774145 RepID=A0AAW3ZNR5_9GAMM|nr:glycoside hydrolase family 2 TIM barrel-domain containing protein [Pseudomarimonas arenosa]MBD8526812.1 hypothetical protein [Pseudomarimonas arenosa]
MSKVYPGWWSAAAAMLASLCGALAAQAGARQQDTAGPSKVEIRQVDGRSRLWVNGVPFHVQGAGLEHGDVGALAARGGNAFRTWRVDNGRERGEAVLDRAQRNGLFVAMGIDVARERHGFDYDDAKAVARQKARVRREVERLKHHPALLLWLVGNELNLEATNPRVWNAVDEIAQMIHELDPHHPVLTPLAGFDATLIEQLKTRAPHLDAIAVQLYGDIEAMPDSLRQAGWTGPYLITEWGTTGHWEVPKTAWGAPIEPDSSVKAALLRSRYIRNILADSRNGLGSFVFLWGQKQERTPSWYGLFTPDGEATEAVDVMQMLWTGAPASNLSPTIADLRVNGGTAGNSVRLRSSETYPVSVRAVDPERGDLTFKWELRHESQARSTGGDRETQPAPVRGAVRATTPGSASLRAPKRGGPYRLFVWVVDGNRNAAHANIPLWVE